MTGIDIRPAVAGDLPAIVEIYNHYIEHTAVTFDMMPYDVERRRDWFGQFAATGRYRIFVAEKSGRVCGFAHSQALKPKGAYLTSVETTVYLAPGEGGHGIGSALYDALFAALEAEDVHRAYGLIVVPNDASVALHLKHGFVPHEPFTEIGRKFGRFHDVQWFERPVPLEKS
jgi:phosphinothricin acetyltransferase